MKRNFEIALINLGSAFLVPYLLNYYKSSKSRQALRHFCERYISLTFFGQFPVIIGKLFGFRKVFQVNPYNKVTECLFVCLIVYLFIPKDLANR